MIALEASARNPRSVIICSVVGSPLYRTIFLVIAIAAGPASGLCAPTPITSRHKHNLDETKAQYWREVKTSKHGQSAFMTIERLNSVFSSPPNASTSSPEYGAAANLGRPSRQPSFPGHRFATPPQPAASPHALGPAIFMRSRHDCAPARLTLQQRSWKYIYVRMLANLIS